MLQWMAYNHPHNDLLSSGLKRKVERRPNVVTLGARKESKSCPGREWVQLHWSPPNSEPHPGPDLPSGINTHLVLKLHSLIRFIRWLWASNYFTNTQGYSEDKIMKTAIAPWAPKRKDRIKMKPVVTININDWTLIININDQINFLINEWRTISFTPLASSLIWTTKCCQDSNAALSPNQLSC